MDQFLNKIIWINTKLVTYITVDIIQNQETNLFGKNIPDVSLENGTNVKEFGCLIYM